MSQRNPEGQPATVRAVVRRAIKPILLVGMVSTLVATMLLRDDSTSAATGALEIHLTDPAGASLGGGCYRIIDAARTLKSACDDDGDGVVWIDDLAEGIARVYQSTAPPGYTVAGSTRPSIVAGSTVQLTLVNAPVGGVGPTPEPSPTATPPLETPTATLPPTELPSATTTATETPVATNTPVATETPVPTRTQIPTQSPTATLTPTPTPTSTPTVTPTLTPSPTPTRVPNLTFSVALTGNDANPGTAALPFRTIQRGLAEALPGDTVVVGPGIYDGAVFVRGGTATASITLRAEVPAIEAAAEARTVLRGDATEDGLRIPGLSYVTIDGFEITNFAVGIAPRADSHHLLIRRNVLRSNADAGVQCASCSFSRIESNAFLDPGPAFPAPAVQDYGLNFYGGTDNVAIGNTFFGKHNQALSLKHSVGRTYLADNTFAGCMYTCVYLGQNDDNFGGEGDLTSYTVTLERNVFRDAYDPDTGAYYRIANPIVIRNVQDATVRNNDIQRMLGAAIRVLSCDGSTGCLTVAGLRPVRATIAGNTIGNPVDVSPDNGEAGGSLAIEIVGRGYTEDTVEISGNTIFDVETAFRIRNTPSTVIHRDTSSPPTLLIHDNQFTNVDTITVDRSD